MSTALYRRYRPDRFEDVIGQDHVTVPLRTALAKDRVNHAYLFSGPRGCGKTTSARILARCLNCAQGPTPTPCGECDSCRDLGTGGPGSLDVLEIDAASHGGVDDARGLRERATFAPVRDRYKILIIDEAHMVTTAGFNALLKIVEEPPEHLKFIFATTEPEKVIGTIRSRTHHYPFRLVPPEPLIAYLDQLCSSEQTQVDHGVLPLVVRAGTGSVRDTLSVLDQLIAGATEGRVDHGLAVNLLGFTPEALLDDVIDSLAADDAQTVFRAVDRVVQSGQDPRRFVEDLLDRFRDLVIARAMPDQAGAVLHGVPEDQVRRLTAQASGLSRAELSRLADVTNEALSEMVGATSPRLHLELLMARLLLPATDESARGLAARVEALERRAAFTGPPAADRPASGEPSPAETHQPGSDTPDDAAHLSGAALARAAVRRPEAEQQASAAGTQGQGHAAGTSEVPQTAATASSGAQQPQSASNEPTRGQPDHRDTAAGPQTPRQPDEREVPTSPSAAAAAQPAGSQDREPAASPSADSSAPSQVERMRRAWPEILAALEDSSRLVWMLVKDNASVAGFDGSLLTIGFTQDGPRQSLLSRRGDQVLADAVHTALGIRPELDLILGGDSPKAEGRPDPAAPAGSAPPQPAQ
ncbi:MAG: DNA polymerase III subunit gamma and tau, partial [Micrococcus sp.]|nr:DNA polymerase III subunit gamma and tau [Micrococcus sp.]